MSTASVANRRRIGIFGGTFDPVHHGHLIVATEMLSAIDLDRVEFVPAGHPPHKPDQVVSSDLDRLTMLRLSIENRDSFVVNSTDIDRQGPSYTSELLTLLNQGNPGCDLYFIMGADSLGDFHTWHEPATILALARLAVAARPGAGFDLDLIASRVPGLRDRIEVVEVPEMQLSSSDIRQRVEAEQPIWYHVPLAVEQYIQSRSLYRRQISDWN